MTSQFISFVFCFVVALSMVLYRLYIIPVFLRQLVSFHCMVLLGYFPTSTEGEITEREEKVNRLLCWSTLLSKAIIDCLDAGDVFHDAIVITFWRCLVGACAWCSDKIKA